MPDLNPNPYVYGAVITEDKQFYGRNDLIQTLSAADERAYFLKGNRRIGKTSLLRFVERKLLSSTGCLPVYVDLSPGKTLQEFGRLFRRSANTVCQRLALPEVPFQSGHNLYQDIAVWLEFAAALNRPKCVLLFDEAEVLLHLSEKELQIMYFQVEHRLKNLTIIITATNKLEKLYDTVVQGNLLLECLTPKKISLLDNVDAEALVMQRNALPPGISIDNTLLADIVKACGGHPYLLQRICYELFTDGQLRPIQPEDLALDSSLRHFFEVDFQHLLEDYQRVLLHFKWETGLGADYFKMTKLPKWEAALAELSTLGFLQRMDTQYFLSNIFLAKWLEEKRVEPHNDEPSPQAPPSARNVFISYAHEDFNAKENLRKHLKILEKNGQISIWEDTHLLPGSQWSPEIEKQLEKADIFIFLVSADLLSSDYVLTKELPAALARHRKDGIPVIPVILRECLWQETDFEQFQALPFEGKPVVSYPRDDQAFAEVAAHLQRILK